MSYVKNSGSFISLAPDTVFSSSTLKYDDLMFKSKGNISAVFGSPAEGEPPKWYTEREAAKTGVSLDRVAYNIALLERSNKGVSTPDFKKFMTELKNISGPDYGAWDQIVRFGDYEFKKDEYASFKLDYIPASGPCPNWDLFMDRVFVPGSRDKVEWFLGAIATGANVDIQKMLVLYADSGTGKSSLLRIIQGDSRNGKPGLFEGYCYNLKTKRLVKREQKFLGDEIAANKPIGIDDDGDLSSTEDISSLNSIISHDTLAVDGKGKATSEITVKSSIILATNKFIRIDDAKSGLARRMIIAKMTGDTFPPSQWRKIDEGIRIERAQIMQHCIDLYESDPDRYLGEDEYVLAMRYESGDEFEFLCNHAVDYAEFVTAKGLYADYQSEVQGPLKKFQLINMLSGYFERDVKRYCKDGKEYGRCLVGLRLDKLGLSDIGSDDDSYDATGTGSAIDPEKWIFEELNPKDTELFKELAKCPAQLSVSFSGEDPHPGKNWDDVTTALKDIDQTKEHYVRPPENHIVIDFDLKEGGKKSLTKNLEAIQTWPLTYAEYSKSGNAIHLHYIYNGDLDTLANTVREDIEIKKFTGKSSLRRKLTKCSNHPIAIITDLPKKEGKKKTDKQMMATEKSLERGIRLALSKKVHPDTSSNVNFIEKILREANEQGVTYDLRNLKDACLKFAASSTNQSERCLNVIAALDFCNNLQETITEEKKPKKYAVWDTEVYPDTFIFGYKYVDPDKPNPAMQRLKPTVLVNPDVITLGDILASANFIGFNSFRYDNEVTYAYLMHGTPEAAYRASKDIITNPNHKPNWNAKDLTSIDIYDYAATKQSLKSWELELGIHHEECGYDWNAPINGDKAKLSKIIGYNANDVNATEAVWYATQADWTARKILAAISGLPLSKPTNDHTRVMVFGPDYKNNVEEIKSEFVYTNLSEIFPGYTYDPYAPKAKRSQYMGEYPGEGGYVYSEPGAYENVAVLDVASMHPHSIKRLNLFGDKYTDRYFDLVRARIFIKHKEYDKVAQLFDGKLMPYLKDDKDAKNLSMALKLAINSVYGLTSKDASTESGAKEIFKDPRNVDNIVAKYGALFMITLKNEVQKRGYKAIHIKTDSIKIPNADQDIIDFVMDFGKQYGFTFEHEDTYEKFFLADKAQNIGFSANEKKWHATGTMFIEPYVFKRIFSKEEITVNDLTHLVEVSKSKLYLGDKFIGKSGAFYPVRADICGAEELKAVYDDGRTSSPPKTKGFKWMEADVALNNKVDKDIIDYSFFEGMVDTVKESMESLNCDFYAFTS